MWLLCYPTWLLAQLEMEAETAAKQIFLEIQSRTQLEEQIKSLEQQLDSASKATNSPQSAARVVPPPPASPPTTSARKNSADKKGLGKKDDKTASSPSVTPRSDPAAVAPPLSVAPSASNTRTDAATVAPAPSSTPRSDGGPAAPPGPTPSSTPPPPPGENEIAGHAW